MYKKVKYVPLFFGISGLLIYLYFGLRALGSNISADDAGFIFGITGGTPTTWLNSVIAYVPGRNLHIFWQVLLFNLTGGSMSDLRSYHLIQGIMFALVAGLVYLILRRQSVSKFISIYFGILVLVFPLFSSVLLWANSLPQHIISSLLFLVGVYLVLPCQQKFWKEHQVSWAVLTWLALTLSLFTYDQSAAATAFLTFTFFAKAVSNNRYKWIPLSSSRLLASLMGSSLIAYVYIFFAGRGTGDNLTFGSKTFGRLIENLMIPTRVMSKFQQGSTSGKTYFHFEPSLILWSLTILSVFGIFVLIKVMFSKNSISPKIGSFNLFAGALFLILSFVAYLPAAIWFVAPRHLYFPVILAFISLGFLTQYISLRISNKSLIRPLAVFIAIFVFCGSAIGFNGQLNSWEKRDSFRKTFYKELNRAIKSQNIDCLVVGRKLNSSDSYLYSESINLAMGYYNGIPIGDSKLCISVPAERVDHFFECSDHIQQDWAELVSYSYTPGPTNFKFKFRQVCKAIG